MMFTSIFLIRISDKHITSNCCAVAKLGHQEYLQWGKVNVANITYE